MRQAQRVLAVDVALPRAGAAHAAYLALLAERGVRVEGVHAGKWVPPPLRRARGGEAV